MYAGYTLEMLGWPKALLIAACGIVITFIMLGILDLIIMVISKVVSSIEGKKPAAAPAPKKAAPAPAAPAAPKQDEGELVSVMMAAVAEQTGMPMGSFQITNVAPVAAAPAAATVQITMETPAETVFSPSAQ